jgi:hypothetical protein
MASRLLTQLRKLEAHRKVESLDTSARPNQMLYVTFWVGLVKVDGALLRPGQEVAVDYYLTKAPAWSSNFCMLEGQQVERVTRDIEDFGVVYDARSVDVQHDYEAGVPAGLPVLGKAVGAGGKIDPYGVEFWNGVSRVRRRWPAKARGAARR